MEVSYCRECVYLDKSYWVCKMTNQPKKGFELDDPSNCPWYRQRPKEQKEPAEAG